MRGAEQPEDSEKQCLICRASWHVWVFLHFVFDELRCGTLHGELLRPCSTVYVAPCMCSPL